MPFVPLGCTRVHQGRTPCTHTPPLTSDPPWQQLLIMLFIGTILGSTARISAVGASKTGLTRTK